MPEPERLALGRYVVGDKLGQGGMGAVYRARADGAEGFAKAVAIKRIHDHLGIDPGVREMFVTEARTAQRLHHGNIVQIIDVGSDDGAPYLVLELVEGSSLSELNRMRGGVPIADALFIAESVASALAYAHGLTDARGRADGLVHRDVTPRNILISRDGVVKLADFGIAKALAAPSYTVPGTFKGSIGYVSPEQALGQAVDARADQFALGIVLHEMLAGENPIAARDFELYLAILANGVPPLVPGPAIDDALVAIIARATAIDPAERYPTMDDLRGELESWRVARKLRTSSESMRATMRSLTAEGATAPTGRALGDALAGVLESPTAATRQNSPRVVASRRRWQWPALGLLGVGAAYVIATRSGSSDPPATVAQDSPPDARTVLDAHVASVAPPQANDAALSVTTATPPTPDAAIAPVQRAKGRLSVNVLPWARVALDGRPLGGVPIRNLEVAAGSHSLVLSNDSGDRVERSIKIEPGALLEVTTW